MVKAFYHNFQGDMDHRLSAQGEVVLHVCCN